MRGCPDAYERQKSVWEEVDVCMYPNILTAAWPCGEGMYVCSEDDLAI